MGVSERATEGSAFRKCARLGRSLPAGGEDEQAEDVESDSERAHQREQEDTHKAVEATRQRRLVHAHLNEARRE